MDKDLDRLGKPYRTMESSGGVHFALEGAQHNFQHMELGYVTLSKVRVIVYPSILGHSLWIFQSEALRF
jgi:hypothetical protein